MNEHQFDMTIPEGFMVSTPEEAQQWLAYFLEAAKRTPLGLDSETTGLNRTRDYVIIWSLSDGLQRICILSELIPYFLPLLENPEVDFDFTNAKFDAHMFANSGADLTKAGRWHDTSVQSWLLNENKTGRHGLKECVEDHLGRTCPTFVSIFGKTQKAKVSKKGIVTPERTTGDLIRAALADPVQRLKAIDYASLDAYNSHVLREHFDEQMKQHIMFQNADGSFHTLFEYYHSIEVPFSKTLYMMERRGVCVDAGHLDEQKEMMTAEMADIQSQFTHAAAPFQAMRVTDADEKPGPFIMNLSSSSPDSKWFFYEVLKKPIENWTDGGESGVKQPKLDHDVLEDMADDGDEWAHLLLRYRDIDKTYGTYVKGLSKHQRQEIGDYRIHTSLNQHGTVTGRLSSSEPNLQNIPRPSEDDFKIRSAFVPGEGMIFIVGDYAQLEMRLMAHFSRDEKMINAILNDIDLHCLTTSEMECIPYDEIIAAVKAEKAYKKVKLGRELTEREIELLLKRQQNKSTGFGIIYGIGGPKLAAKLSRETKHFLSPEEGIQKIKKWLSVFPGVRAYIDYTQSFLRQHGKVQTLLGRWRRFGDIKSMSKKDAARAERQGVNSIIQGSASDIAKVAMIRCENDPLLKELGVRMLLQIHDELMFEMPLPDFTDRTNVKRAVERIKEIMEHPFGSDLLVPLPVELGTGFAWDAAK
jgi:DNA polymerase I